MSRFGDSANGPSVLDISNISGVSADIDTLADHATAISNLGPVATEISNLGTTAVIADMSALGTQAVRDDMDALADVTTELGVLGNTTTAGYIAAIGTSTVGATSQLTVDALGQLTSEISLLASNITTLQNSASNSPIQLGNLSDVDFTSNSPSLGDTIVFTSNNKFEAQALPGAGPLSGTNLTVTNPQVNEILKISAVNAGVPEYVNATVSALVYSADFDNLTEVAAATPAAAGEVVHYDGTSAWTVGQLDYSEITGTPSLHAVATSGASTDLSDTANLVYQSSGTINGDYVINGNLDIATNYELRVDTIDPYPDGAGATPGTLTILGNLQVDGTTTTINTQDLLVTDSTIVVAKDATSASAANGAGFEIGNYVSNPAFLYDGSAADKFTLNRDLDVGTNQLYFSNVFSTSSDLPAAGSYHGMFAHVHADAAAYYAHDGNWVKLVHNNDTQVTLGPVTFGGANGVITVAPQSPGTSGTEGGEFRLSMSDQTTNGAAYWAMDVQGANSDKQNFRFLSANGEQHPSGGGSEVVVYKTNGQVKMSQYGSGTFVNGPAVKSLAVNSAGDIIEEPLGATVGVAAAMAIVF